MSAAHNTRARSAEIAEVMKEQIEKGGDYIAIIKAVMWETNCQRATALKHWHYALHPETCPPWGKGYHGGRKPGSKNKASRPA